jgi:hypothetical protein
VAAWVLFRFGRNSLILTVLFCGSVPILELTARGTSSFCVRASKSLMWIVSIFSSLSVSLTLGSVDVLLIACLNFCSASLSTVINSLPSLVLLTALTASPALFSAIIFLTSPRTSLYCLFLSSTIRAYVFLCSFLYSFLPSGTVIFGLVSIPPSLSCSARRFVEYIMTWVFAP